MFKVKDKVKVVPSEEPKGIAGIYEGQSGVVKQLNADPPTCTVLFESNDVAAIPVHDLQGA